jgi:hypothetical protein
VRQAENQSLENSFQFYWSKRTFIPSYVTDLDFGYNRHRMCGTSAVSIPQPAPHPLRTPCLGGPHYTYTAFLAPVIEGREDKKLEPERGIAARNSHSTIMLGTQIQLCVTVLICFNVK